MDYLFPDKKVPQFITRSTRELIELIGETKNKSTQQEIINQEIQNVKAQLNKGCSTQEYPDILVKLIYFQTLGYNSSFAHILPINLCQSSNLYLKKMAYLLAALLVKPGDELCLLMSNTIIKDLQSENVFVIMTTLTLLRYFLTNQLIIHIIPILKKLTKHSNSILRRKSYLALYNIHQSFDILVPDIKTYALEALYDQECPVMFAGLNMLYSIVMKCPHENKEVTQKLVDILMNIINHKYPQEYAYHKIPAPWAQIQILKMLEALGRNDQQASCIMYEAISKEIRYCTNLSASIHFSKGILQQAIKTACNIYPSSDLVEQSLSTVYKFFDYDTSDMKYYGICCLHQLVKLNKQCLDSWQMMLIDCLNPNDVTLADKTLDLFLLIANQQNSEHILNKIIALTEKSTEETEKRKLIKKSLFLIESFSENREIFLRRMNEIFYKFENLISDGSINNFLRTLLEITSLEPGFIDIALSTYIEIMEHFCNSALLKVSSWVIGEFTHRIFARVGGKEIVDRSVEVLISCGSCYLEDSQIVFMILSSLMKLVGIEMTTKHEVIKRFMLRVEASSDYFTHKIAEQYIRNAKYSKALALAEEIELDHRMQFLRNYVEDNMGNTPKKFLISRVNQNEVAQQDRQLERDELQGSFGKSKSNIFEFKPGSRWGNPQTQKTPSQQGKSLTLSRDEETEFEIVKNDLHEKKKELNLRGPKQGKKNSNKQFDIKKLTLAKTLFGKKK